jgi:peptidyl-prolyl cis-trans isomerase D
LTTLAHAAQVIGAAFASDVGVDNDPVEVDGGYIWYNVAGITPARDRSLDEVKDQVEARWREDEIAARLKTRAADLVDKLKAGTAFDAIAGAEGLKLQTAEKLTRGKLEGGVSPKVIAAAFRTAKDGFGSAEGTLPSDWVVFRVTDVTTPKFDANAPDAKRIGEMVKNQEGDEIYLQYIAWLQKKLGTSINEAAAAQAIGNGGSDTN